MARKMRWDHSYWHYEIGHSIPPISGYPKPKKARKRWPAEQTFAQRHRWGAESNWGIGSNKKKPAQPHMTKAQRAKALRIELAEKRALRNRAKAQEKRRQITPQS